MIAYANSAKSLFGATAVVLALAGCNMMPRSGNEVTMNVPLSGAAEVPPVATSATGTAEVKLNKSTNLLSWKVSYSGLSGPATAGHFHGPAASGANAGVVLPFTGTMSSGMTGQATLTAAQLADLMAGRWYVNIHTAANPGGEIRGQVTPRM